MEKYSITFNRILIHRIIPELIFLDIDKFYESILPYPERIQQFLQYAVKLATEQSECSDDIEPPYKIDTFKIGLEGSMDLGILWIHIPNCKKALDCIAVAFPTTKEQAGYYTCEYSINPYNNDSYYIIGGWASPIQHLNFGKSNSEQGADFVDIVHEIAYASLYAKVYCNTGFEHFQAKQYDEAIDFFSKAINAEPNFASYLFRGVTYEQIGDYNNAIADLDKAIQMDSNDSNAYYYRGKAYGHISQYQQAIADLEKAYELQPDLFAAYEELRKVRRKSLQ